MQGLLKQPEAASPQQQAKSDQLCPDQVQPLEVSPGELDVARPAVVGDSSSFWCLPACVADAVPSHCSERLPSCCSSSCQHSPEDKMDKPLVVSVEILGLVVLGDGLLTLPLPRNPTVLDPRTWFAWQPMVEVAGLGSPVTSSEGKRASSVDGAGDFAAEGCWDGLAFCGQGKPGPAQVEVNGSGVMRFRVLRARPTALLGGQGRHCEEAFTANLHMEHDYFAQGCPDRLVRPIFLHSAEGDIRHVGHLHLRLQACGLPRLVNAASAAPSLRVPEDYPTVQAALDAVLPRRATEGSLARVVLSNGVHVGDARIRKAVVLEAGAEASPIIEGNIIIGAGGEEAEVRRLEVHGFVSVIAGAPLIAGCTICEAGGARGQLQGGHAKDAVAALSVSGSSVRPIIEGNTIRNGCGPGVLFENGARGTLRDNTVQGNAASGVEARDFGTSPTVEGNRILENAQHGLFVHYGAFGVFAENDIHRNKLSGIMLQADTGAGLVVKRNRVHENDQGGIVAEGLSSNIAEREICDNEEIGPARPPKDAIWTSWSSYA